MNVYAGSRGSNGTTVVTANGQALSPRPGPRQALSTVYDWGYAGRGAPAQLALAILSHHLRDDERARRHYERFLRSVICKLPSEAWILTGTEIDSALPGAGR